MSFIAVHIFTQCILMSVSRLKIDRGTSYRPVFFFKKKNDSIDDLKWTQAKLFQLKIFLCISN